MARMVMETLTGLSVQLSLSTPSGVGQRYDPRSKLAPRQRYSGELALSSKPWRSHRNGPEVQVNYSKLASE